MQEIIIDNLTTYSDQDLREVLGLIPHFCTRVTNEESSDTPLKDRLTNAYGFGTLIGMAGTVTDDGVYHFPNDPDLTPLANIHVEGVGMVRQYDYGIVAIYESGGLVPFITRMD